MHLGRTKRAFDRWKQKNIYLESKIIGQSNKFIRDTLLSKGHLIPPSLVNDTHLLIEHYDVWLEEFERVRGSKEPALDAEFVFAGPKGYLFPQEAEKNFTQYFKKLQGELYGGEYK